MGGGSRFTVEESAIIQTGARVLVAFSVRTHRPALPILVTYFVT
jgi:hypothetical protein